MFCSFKKLLIISCVHLVVSTYYCKAVTHLLTKQYPRPYVHTELTAASVSSCTSYVYSILFSKHLYLYLCAVNHFTFYRKSICIFHPPCGVPKNEIDMERGNLDAVLTAVTSRIDFLIMDYSNIAFDV